MFLRVQEDKEMRKIVREGGSADLTLSFMPLMEEGGDTETFFELGLSSYTRCSCTLLYLFAWFLSQFKILKKTYKENIRDLDCSVHIYYLAEMDAQPSRVNRLRALT